VFGGSNGERPRPGNVSAAFGRAVERFRRELGDAAPPRITLHGTRHTMITTWLTAGVPVKVVAERAGHTVQTMLSTYSHLLADSQAGVVERMAGLLTAAGQ
jgi:integrase